MDWLGQRVRDHLGNTASNELRQNVLTFPGDTPAALRSDSSAALDLVSQAAEMIGSIQDRAAEMEARAKALADSALKKLQRAETLIHTAEAERDRAQDALSKLGVRLEEAERDLTRTQSQIATAEAQLADAERYAKTVATRALNAEKALNQIEDAIRTQLLGLHNNLTRGSVRAA